MVSKQKQTEDSFPTVCIVGAGISGICAGVQLKTKLNLESFTIFERNQDIGGVWLQNTYPGVACDIPALVYSYSFQPNPDWSKTYVGQEEIWSYLQSVAKQYELYSHIRFNTAVRSICWDKVRLKWTVTSVHNGDAESVEKFDIAIVATGPLRDPYKPTEFGSFTGPVMHSAEWNSTVKLENKVVGVIGTGASSVQVVPAIANKVKELIVYQRSAQYVMPIVLQTRTSKLTKLIKRIPGVINFGRFMGLYTNCLLVGTTKNGSFLNKTAQALHRLYLWCFIKDKVLRQQLTPNYPFGARFFYMSSKFYPALCRPNVELVTSKISSIAGNTITTADGCTKELDVLILCTGFVTQNYFAPIQIIGYGGIDLLQEWKRAWPKTYYGVTCNASPNMFFLIGPNNGMLSSLVWVAEWQCEFIVNMINELRKKGAHSFQVKKTVEDECWKEITTAMKKSVFNLDKGINSYFTNAAGQNTFVWPETPAAYRRKIKEFEPSRFNFA